MSTTISGAAIAVAVPPPADLPVDKLEPLAVEAPRVQTRHAALSAVGARLKRGVRLVFTALGSFGEILAVAFAFPVAILAIGIPIALVVRLLIWVVRAL